jgi:hypothetical protein
VRCSTPWKAWGFEVEDAEGHKQIAELATR